MAPLRFLLPALILTAVGPVVFAAPDRRDLDFYETKVRPLLSERCYACHSVRAGKLQAGLRLDTPEGWLKGGTSGAAVAPGDPDHSRLIQAVRGAMGAPQMPPGSKLSPTEIETLTDWVRRGAPVPAASGTSAAKPNAAGTWWAFQPLHPVAQPKVRNESWCRTPIDRFVLAKLEAKGLRPNPPADRRTLIRRAYFDLIGLPPSPAEVDAFVQDRSPKAWEKVVDGLLASPRYGERWARHWLDVVHYADTHGYDKDKRRDHAWPYRDYVIRALNEDRPFSRFIQEQVAGDLLFPGEPDGVIATGFIAAGPWDFVGEVELAEGTVEKAKTRLLDRDDMVASTISTFDSVTIHCARCHDHKFDPIPQRDYYRLQAVFSGVERGDRPYSDPATTERRAGLESRRKQLVDRLATLDAERSRISSPELQQLDRELESRRHELASMPVPFGAPGSPSNGYHSAISPSPDQEKWVQIDLGRPVPIDEIRLVPARPTDFPDSPGFGFPVHFRVEASDDASFAHPQIVLDRSAADFPNPGIRSVGIHPRGITARYVRVTAERLWLRTNDYIFALGEMEVLSGGRNVAAGAGVTAKDSIEGGRWSTRYLVDEFDSRNRMPDRTNPAVAEFLGRRSRLEREIESNEQNRLRLIDAHVEPKTRAERTASEAELARVDQEVRALPGPSLVYSVVPHAPRPIRVLARGDVERPKELVSAGTLSCLSGLRGDFGLSESADEGQRRAALARWISDPKNPLTWRSIVNRVWQFHFGRGIVETPNDFGRNGALPTHPELLEFLATSFAAGVGGSHGLGPVAPSGALGPGAGDSTHPPTPSPNPGRGGDRPPHDQGNRGTKVPPRIAGPRGAPLAGSLKKLHRLIMLSNTYQMSSESGGRGSGAGGRGNAGKFGHRSSNPQSEIRNPQSKGPQSKGPQLLDADNHLLWRMNRRRLEAEEIRDTILDESGKLNLTMGGPGFELFRFKDDHSPIYDHTAVDRINNPEGWRRAIYRFTVRSVPNPFLDCLDGADPNANTPVRNTTLTALQALALRNDPFVIQQAGFMAERLRTLAPDRERQVDQAVRLTLGRPPSPGELHDLTAYAQRYGLANTCRLLFSLNEFVFVD